MKRNILILLAFMLVIPMGFAQKKDAKDYRLSDKELGYHLPASFP